MTAKRTISSVQSVHTPVTSRRDMIAATVTLAAAGGAISSAPAAAQTPAARHANPAGMFTPPGYSQIVEVNGPYRMILIAGQTAQETSGKLVPGGFREQATQVMENIKTALASVGGTFDDVVKINTYLLDIDRDGPAYREIRATYFSNKVALPASTLLQVSRLADPQYLIEVEATAILPPKS